jgi:kumamolisin
VNALRFSNKMFILCLLVASANAATPNAVDRGPLDARTATTPMSVTVALKLPHLEEAEKLLEALYRPGDPQYHEFLTAEQFVARFAPTDADVAKVVAALTKYGLKSEKTTATTLKVTGLPSDFERTFQISLHSFEVAARGKVAGYTYRAATGRATIPAEISAAVSAVVGFDTSPVLAPQFKLPPPVIKSPFATTPSASGLGDPFQLLTVTDFAKYYDVEPLYKKGITGAGRTIGVLTFASFTPSDAFTYWAAVGLKVNPNRIQIVNVDGGPGAPSDASGSDETTLDVEQAGGIAPGANIIVYQGSNFFVDLVNVFAAAIDANQADSLGMSWGVWEWLTNLENYPAPDPITGKTVAATQAVHELLLRAAIQGQTVYSSSGDGGAYEAQANFGCTNPYSPSVANSCSLALTALYPAADPYITAAGGTTLPGLQQLCANAACTPPYFDVNIKHESVWGWDYLVNFCAQVVGLSPQACGIFPVGSGGGVSITFPLPLYQFGVFGTQVSQPNQAFYLQPDGLLDALAAFYPGRNLPDVSFNADPETGYVIYYTSSVTGFGEYPGYGGTSFVDQQLSGVTALLDQALNKRIGFLNPTLYGLVQSGRGYVGPNAPLNPIAYGDNWFYHGSNGYNLGAGVGTMDVANFAQALRSEFF